MGGLSKCINFIKATVVSDPTDDDHAVLAPAALQCCMSLGAIGPEHGTVLALATEVRAELRESTGTSESPAWVDALDDDLLDLVRAGDRDGARARLRTALGLDGPLVDGASR